jgi:hypothetical protein
VLDPINFGMDKLAVPEKSYRLICLVQLLLVCCFGKDILINYNLSWRYKLSSLNKNIKKIFQVSVNAVLCTSKSVSGTNLLVHKHRLYKNDVIATCLMIVLAITR